jgi:hypothetical protein
MSLNNLVDIYANTVSTDQLFVNGVQISGDATIALNYRGDWSAIASYAPNDVVFYHGSSYAALIANVNSPPALQANPVWGILARWDKRELSGKREPSVPPAAQAHRDRSATWSFSQRVTTAFFRAICTLSREARTSRRALCFLGIHRGAREPRIARERRIERIEWTRQIERARWTRWTRWARWI